MKSRCMCARDGMCMILVYKRQSLFLNCALLFMCFVQKRIVQGMLSTVLNLIKQHVRLIDFC